MLKSPISRWKSRKKYKTFSEMPDLLVACFAISGFLVAGFCRYVLGKVVPEYLEAANKVPLSQWGWQGWLLSTILAAFGFMVWHCGSISWRCNGILRDRWYK
ncbi:hypothetical protein [Candidatus Nitrospira inopinata]|uniref:hypothetical protein n=1 Tax=Candidatus Nitrospira inopinata TaxID=1715989 RepID=UPI0013016C3B|nr:hypothetical protein [Candidatus Nitrospira inopinata]